MPSSTVGIEVRDRFLLPKYILDLYEIALQAEVEFWVLDRFDYDVSFLSGNLHGDLISDVINLQAELGLSCRKASQKAFASLVRNSGGPEAYGLTDGDMDDEKDIRK